MKKGIRRALIFSLRALTVTFVMLPLIHSPHLLQAQFISLPVDLSYLSQRADVIVQGKIISVRHENLPGHQNFPTVTVTLEVEKMLRGPSASTYTFREAHLGFGLKGGKQNYQVGQRLLLFLPSPSQMGLSSPIGFEQGRFHIARNAGGTEAIANEVGNTGLFKNVEQKASKQGEKTDAGPGENCFHKGRPRAAGRFCFPDQESHDTAEDPMNKSNKGLLLVWLFLLGAHAIPAFAGGPNYVTGYKATNPGQAYRWASGTISYRTDLGALGNQTNTDANRLVTEAFQAWQNVPTASLSVQNAGQLSHDITAADFPATGISFADRIGNCSDASQPTNSIVYDQNGSIITALGYDNNSTLGFAGSICADHTAGTYTRGWALLNGRFIDGQPNTTSHQTVTLDQFKSAFTHEFGHLLGLDHSQVNLNCLTQSCSLDDIAGLPIMFPFLLNQSQGTLSTDDIAAISVLYPALSFSASTGRIQGRVFFSDGQTPAEGYNVIARQVGNPRRIAVSSVSGFLFTSFPGNSFNPDNDIYAPYFGADFGSHDTNLIGYFDIPGLPPGDYTIEVEAINNDADTAFVGSSSVGPIGFWIGFQFKLPGSCAPQYLNFPSAPTDICSAKSTVPAVGGYVTSINTDIILLGTQPRYDQWEDGP